VGRKKKAAEASDERRLAAIPVEGPTPELALEMLEDCAELKVVIDTMDQLKVAIAELRVRKEDLDIRMREWGSGYVPPVRKPVQIALNLGDRFDWLDQIEEVRARWKKASEVQRDYSPDWVSEASAEVEDGSFLTPETVPTSEKHLMELEQLVEQARLDGKSSDVELLAARVRKYAGKPRADDSLSKIREMVSARPMAPAAAEG